MEVHQLPLTQVIKTVINIMKLQEQMVMMMVQLLVTLMMIIIIIITKTTTAMIIMVIIIIIIITIIIIIIIMIITIMIIIIIIKSEKCGPTAILYTVCKLHNIPSLLGEDNFYTRYTTAAMRIITCLYV